MREERSAAVAPARPRWPTVARLDLLREYAIVVSVVVLFVVLSFASDVFLTPRNLLNVLEQVAPTGLVAFALTFLLVVGEFDLSAGAIFVFAGILAAKLQPAIGTGPALGAGVAAAVGLGVVNGLLVAYARISSFVCTLATSLMVAGLGLVITHGFLLNVQDPSFGALGTETLLGVKWSIWILVAAALASSFVLARTKLGRWLYAVGGNAEAARVSGIDTRAIKASAFAVSGLAAGLGGAILVSRTATGQAGNGIDIVLAAFAAVVGGGTRAMGGRGAVLGGLLGVLVLGLVTNRGKLVPR